MTGTLGTLWARYKTLIWFWLVTLLLFVAGMGIQVWEADLSNRFAVTKQADANDVQVTVIYPSKIFLPSPNAPIQEIVFRVTAPDSTGYTLWLENSDALVFYDDSGGVISPHWEGQGSAVFHATVEAAPRQSGRTMFLRAVLSVDSFLTPISLGQVAIESLAESRWRIGLGIFARNIALPLSLLSAITGWVVSYLAKETDKLEIAFREKMGKMATEFRLDPLYAVEQCLELKRVVGKKSLGRDAEKELNHAVRNLFNRDGVGRLLKRIGEYASRQDNVALMSALSSVGSLYQKFASVIQRDSGVETVFRALGHVYRYFSEQKNFVLLYDTEQNNAEQSNAEQRPKAPIGKWDFPSWAQNATEWVRNRRANKRLRRAKHIVDQLLHIWSEQDVFGADFVIYGLNRFRDIQTVAEHVKEKIESKPNFRRLKRYKQLDWIHDPMAAYYEWPDLQTWDEPYHYPMLHSWFKSGRFLFSNPFDKSNILRMNIRPEHWEHYISDKPAIFTSNSTSDLRDAALLAQKSFQAPVSYGQRGAKLAFPIFFEIPAALESNHWLSALAHRGAEVWLDFLSHSPDAYLDMYPEERQALASWLGWHCGSNDVVVERLRQRLFRVLNVYQGDTENAKKQAGRLLLDFLEEGRCHYTRENQPAREQILHWLGIRPFGIDYTVIILVASYTLSDSFSQVLMMSSAILLAHGVVLKQFRVAQDVLPEHSIAVTWSKETIKAFLASCVKTPEVSLRFADLFEKPLGIPPAVLPDYNDQLAEKAQGSLNRLLELGLRILQHHAEKYPEEPYLKKEDFEAIKNL
ncbi:MAG: hypothetical protein ABWK53_12275 [Anaerolineales bacterium]